MKTPINKTNKPYNESSSDSEDKNNTSNKNPGPKHDKSDVAHHFLDFYSDDESERTLDVTTDISTKYHVFKDDLTQFDKQL